MYVVARNWLTERKKVELRRTDVPSLFWNWCPSLNKLGLAQVLASSESDASPIAALRLTSFRLHRSLALLHLFVIYFLFSSRDIHTYSSPRPFLSSHYPINPIISIASLPIIANSSPFSVTSATNCCSLSLDTEHRLLTVVILPASLLLHWYQHVINRIFIRLPPSECILQHLQVVCLSCSPLQYAIILLPYLLQRRHHHQSSLFDGLDELLI